MPSTLLFILKSNDVFILERKQTDFTANSSVSLTIVVTLRYFEAEIKQNLEKTQNKSLEKHEKNCCWKLMLYSFNGFDTPSYFLQNLFGFGLEI